ncbi:MAG: heavy metal translocating P-type ATPase [Chloroflexota bacterium]
MFDVTLRITGMDCADCAAKIERNVARMPGVTRAVLTFTTGKMRLEYDGRRIYRHDIERRIRALGYGIAGSERHEVATGRPRSFWVANSRALLTVIAGAFLVAALIAGRLIGGMMPIGLYAAAIVIGGYYPVRAGVVGFTTARTVDMNGLMTIAVIGAVAMAQWEEAATVIVLFSLGNALESLTMERTRESIRSLIDLAPREATVIRDGREQLLSVDDIVAGDTVVIRPGERLPVDGRVLTGTSAINQAPITGESLPVDKGPGAEVFAGTINGSGALTIVTERVAADTTLARIVQMVEAAQAQRAPSQRFVDVFARYYTPIVTGLAFAVAVLPPLFGAPFRPWLYRGLTLLVVSCPCALVISTPVTIVAGIGNAARNGVLIKGGAHLEQAGAITAVAFDKTGTLTTGVLEVTEVIATDGDPDAVLAIAAAIERRSEHPIAEAIVRHAAARGIRGAEVERFAAIAGKGAKARIDGRTYYVGSPRFFASELGAPLDGAVSRVEALVSSGRTVVAVGSKGNLIGLIAVADRPRVAAAAAIGELKANGVRRVAMLTGDARGTAEAIAAETGVDEVLAELLPQDKVSAVTQLAKQHGPVAMVGDGINDAPALAAATVGIAMGGAGTDAALETADIALMGDDPRKIAYAIRLSRKARNIIRQNIVFSLVVKLVAVTLVFPGWLNLWIAIAADTGAALVVIANGMRLLRARG